MSLKLEDIRSAGSSAQFEPIAFPLGRRRNALALIAPYNRTCALGAIYPVEAATLCLNIKSAFPGTE